MTQYNYEYSTHLGLDGYTYHRGCGGSVVEIRAYAQDQWDPKRCYLVCFGIRQPSLDSLIEENFDPEKADASTLCLCVKESTITDLVYWSQNERHDLAETLFENVVEGNLAVPETILKLEEDPVTGATFSRPATWAEERSYYRKETEGLIAAWTVKAVQREGS